MLGYAENAGADFNTSEKNAHNDEKTLQHKFFKEILSLMQNAEEVHLTGTGTSQEQLMHYMEETPQFKNSVTQESTQIKSATKTCWNTLLQNLIKQYICLFYLSPLNYKLFFMAKKSKSTISIVKEAVHDIAENLKESAGNKVSDIKDAIADKISDAKVAGGNLLQKAGKNLAGKKAASKSNKKASGKKTAIKKAAAIPRKKTAAKKSSSKK